MHAISAFVLHFQTSDSVWAFDSKEYFVFDTGSSQSYLKSPGLVRAVTSSEGDDTQYGKALSFVGMLCPHMIHLQFVVYAAETKILDVAVGFKTSSTSRNTGVHNINLLGTDFLDNFCIVDDRISQDLKVLPHYRKNLRTMVVPSLEQA